MSESRFIRRIISFKRISRLKLFYSAELAQVGSTVCFQRKRGLSASIKTQKVWASVFNVVC
ncbi:hypothetical protein ACMZ8A_01110 [Gardnerella swidsinskii]|uniref:hypothetical protein n=1 Tax=Gardnerella swidsinskii TaxID=2792979 RepID=UPI0039EE37F7